MMIELTPAISNYLTLLLGRLELYRKTDIAELDLKQRNSLHDIRSKVKALLDKEVPLASACVLTDTLMTIWLQRQQALAAEICLTGRDEVAAMNQQYDDSLESDLDSQLHDVEEKAFHKILNDQSTTEKLKDIKQLFTLVNEICSTLKEEQTEVRRLKTTGGGRQCINENTLIANLRQCTTEELAAPSVAGRVFVDCVIGQLNGDFDQPVSPLLAHPTHEAIKAKAAQNGTQQQHQGEGGGAALEPGSEPASTREIPNIYDNVVSFESDVIIHEIPNSSSCARLEAAELDSSGRGGRLEDFAAAADASILRPIGRRPRVKFNTRKELQENALLGLCCDEPLLAGAVATSCSPGLKSSSLTSSEEKGGLAARRGGAAAISKSSADVMGRRRMSISSRFQSNMDEISDELRGLSEWKNC